MFVVAQLFPISITQVTLESEECTYIALILCCLAGNLSLWCTRFCRILTQIFAKRCYSSFVSCKPLPASIWKPKVMRIIDIKITIDYTKRPCFPSLVFHNHYESPIAILFLKLEQATLGLIRTHHIKLISEIYV